MSKQITYHKYDLTVTIEAPATDSKISSAVIRKLIQDLKKYVKQPHLMRNHIIYKGSYHKSQTEGVDDNGTEWPF